MKLVDFSLRRRVTVAMCAVAVVLFGVVAFTRLPINLLPELSYPSLTVETRFPGAAPAEVEALLTRPVEELVGVVNGVQRLSSVSRPGLSQVTLEFGWGRDMDFAAVDVRQKLDLLRFPQDAEKPVILRFDPANDPIMRLYLTGGADLYQLRYVAEEVLKKDLESTEGVAAIQVHGGYEEEIQVEVDERKLALMGLSIDEISDRLLAENLNQAGGSLYEEEARYLVRARNEFEDLDDVRDTVVLAQGNRQVTLGDVAVVTRGHKQRDVVTRFGGEEAVELAIYKEGDANTVQVARALQNRLENVDDEMPEGIEVAVGVDQSRFINASISEVLGNAVLGGIIAMGILLLFLKDARSTLIIGVSIPISIVTTFFLMYRTGTSLNIMSLGGLALGVGMLVDNAIVVLEAIVKRREEGLTDEEAARTGASEVGQAVVASTLTTVAVFLPVVFLEGVASQLFWDQALTVSLSLLASLAVSLTLIPMLMAATAPRSTPTAVPVATATGRTRSILRAVFVTGPSGLLAALRFLVVGLARLVTFLGRPLSRAFDAVFDRVTDAYPGLLSRALERRGTVLLVALLLLLGAAWLAPQLGVDLIPTFAQGEFSFQVQLPEGTPIEATDRFLADLQTVLEDQPTVESYASIAGGAGLALASTGTEGENMGVLQVRLGPGTSPEAEAAVIDVVRARLASAEGASFTFERPTYFSFRTPIEVEVYADDLRSLHDAAGALYPRVAEVPGLVDVESSAELGNPELQVTFDRQRLATLGLDLGTVAGIVRSKVQGAVATRFTEGDREIDIRVRSLGTSRARVADLENLIVGEPEGRPIHLKSVATIRTTAGPSEIRRIGQRRAAVISGNIQGRDMGAVAADVRAAIVDTPLPGTVTAALSGQEEEMSRSLRSLLLAMALAIFLVYLVMASQFESFLHPFVIIFTLPLGAIGVVAALAATGKTVSVVAMIGAVMLAGIVVNNGIVLIDAVNQRRRDGLPRRKAILDAAASRVRPIFMTSATTIVGLLPMALGLGEGAELRAPLAITVIGGLAVATVLTLFVIPVVYTLLDRQRDPVATATEVESTAVEAA